MLKTIMLWKTKKRKIESFTFQVGINHLAHE